VPAVRLRLFGSVPEGNEGYAEEIRRLADDLGLAGAVTFEGPVSPVTRAFAAGQIVVMSSTSEGLPLTVIEAAMSGRPTVVTDAGGMAEAAGDGGLVVPPGNPAAFAAACVALLTDPGRRKELGAAGRRYALAHFTRDRFVADVRGIYAEFAAPAAVPAPVVRASAKRDGTVTDLPSLAGGRA
jgi:glycosyltransferase involved in cell wall biosynthesis